ncbi:hypothetical protein NJI98_005216 [Escherichia coli]|nr:hypothetical protein [Escherichia coli]
MEQRTQQALADLVEALKEEDRPFDLPDIPDFPDDFEDCSESGILPTA